MAGIFQGKGREHQKEGILEEYRQCYAMLFAWAQLYTDVFTFKKKLETKFDPQTGDPNVPSILSESRDFESLV